MTAVTWNPSDKGAQLTLSGGNRIITPTTGFTFVETARATLARSTGKYYFEVRVADAANGTGVSVGLISSARSVGDTNASLGFGAQGATEWASYVGIASGNVDGNMMHNGSYGNAWSGGTWGSGPVIGIAVDLDAGKMWLASNNTWKNSGNPASGTNPEYTGVTGTLYPAVNDSPVVTYVLTGYFKVADLNYSPPSGFSAWDDTVDNVGAAAGTSLVTATGASLAAAVGSVAGTSTAAAVTPPAVGSAAGTSTVAAVGYAFAPIGASAGTSTALAVGRFVLTSSLQSSVNIASAARCAILAGQASSINLASVATGSETAGLASALNLASVITGQRTGTRSLASTVDFASTADGDKTGSLASSINIASTATGVRETDCASALQLTAVATGITTRNERLVSTANFASAVEPLDAVALTSALNIASAVVGIKTVALSLASNLNLASATVGSKVDALALTSALNVASTVSFNAVLHESLVSTFSLSSFVRLPSGALMQLFTNPQTMAAATWSGLPFNSMIEVDGVVYGAGVNGLYVLDDDEDDIGEDVDAEVTWDLMNFGDHNKKRYEGGYVSGTAAGPLNFRFVNDQGTFNYPTDRSSAAHPVNHRATFGRGLFSSYARVSLTNLNGKTFDVSDVRVQLYKTTRRS